MTTVYVVQHEHEWCGHDEVKFIGVYATQSDAETAVERLCIQPGFCNWPDGFAIDAYELGVDHWCEGFITLTHILVQSSANPAEFQVAQAVWRPGDLYEIVSLYDCDDSHFAVGDIVRCLEQSIPEHGERTLVVSEIVSRNRET